MKPTTRALLDQARTRKSWAATQKKPLRAAMAKHHRDSRKQWGGRAWTRILVPTPDMTPRIGPEEVTEDYEDFVNRLFDESVR